MSDLDVTIRPERPGDHAAIRSVVSAAFGSHVEADLVERIRSSSGYVPELALVAVEPTDGGRVVGHVMVSTATLRHATGERPVAMLSPLAVTPDVHRRGVGGQLVRTVVGLTGARGEPLVVLEGSPAYYSRLGFEPAARYGIEMPLPGWAPPEAAQVHRLAAYDPGDASLRGTVVYPPAFDGVD